LCVLNAKLHYNDSPHSAHMTISVAKILGFLVVAAVLLVKPAQSMAADTKSLPPDRPAIPLVHTSWLIKDGAPQGAVDIAQTPDGWIWISSPVGLFRFDGVSFSRYRPPQGQSMPVSTHRIGVLNDGTLWVTARFGGLYFIKGDTFRSIEASEHNFPDGAMGKVVRDASGRIWVASWSGLFSLDPGASTWRDMNEGVGLPKTPINDLLVDRQGTMWAIGPKAIYARRKDEARFQKISEKTGSGRLAQAPDGSVWASDMGGKGVRQLWAERNDPKYDILKQEEFNAFNFLIDTQGNFWFPKNNGVIRVEFGKKASSIQKYTSQQGLSGATVNTVFEDREGNIWVLTDSGIDQFRPSRMHLLSLPSLFGEPQAVLAGPDGDFWVDHNYFRHIDSHPEPFAPRPTEKDLITVLYRDPHGGVWCASLEGLWKLNGLKRIKIALPPELAKAQGSAIYSLAMDADNGLWISFDNEAWRLKDGAWQKHGNIPALKDAVILSMAPAPDKSLWFGTVRQNILVLRDGKTHTLGRAEGLDVGAIMQIVPHGTGAYISGESGLVFFDGRRAIRIRGEHDEIFPSISGLVIMPNGDLWGNSGVGLIGISASEIASALKNPDHLVRFQRYDESDGLIGTAPPLLPLPSMVRTSANKLIISTTSGAFRFDPVRARIDNAALPLEITAVTAAGNTQAPSSGLRLDQAPDSVRIDYTALRFRLPHRVRFRYLLEGFDQHWQDAGTRRSAFYTKLPPGIYHFKVMTANDDGVWSHEVAQVTFEIPPTFVQTGWFKLICLAVVLLLGWLLHRLRLHVALRRLTATFEARAAEREHIARDLHDTLLQSVQGLILAFGGIVKRMPDTEPLKGAMNNALDLADEVMEEGRNKVNGLRTALVQHNELAIGLDEFGRSLSRQHLIAFTMLLHGQTRLLRTCIHNEILMIGREAIRNAFAHAKASEIKVELTYSERLVELSVKDDGCGIDTDAQKGRPGHWGMQGMRERAAQLGASLELSSARDCGTTWRLRIPG
jgi:signal transduction histidine kinase/ligand-binding sensor domain-containing protein